ncbi:hypothetical protein HYH03_005580 [Edaphochlamys debaryana]|uniref:Wax synthase domain-containing protein n=1 Tax=Edaphochlamys debaryana TaxID=47281 RepID=A0A835Y570_9CHLO|nr:hypothetical protein HYH03_005580 [Edaphochlamys debaryana]|eukprot:KAG2496350.1 hypothetical protein HYH03_005580 [Edaphochlamys debaryana]
MWVASFKLLAYSGDRGALAHPGIRNASGWKWAALLLLPFFPAKKGREPARTSPTWAAMGILCRLALWLGLNQLLLAPPFELPAAARHVCYAGYMWFFVSLCLDLATPLSGALLSGVPLQPAMDAPYAAVSVREFWGRRYNQIVSATLLETVYKPLVERRWVAEPRPDTASPADASAGAQAGSKRVAVRAGPPPDRADAPAGPSLGNGAPATPDPQTPKAAAAQRPRVSTGLSVAALMASFVVSGLMHELVIAMMCRRLEGSFRMTSFFIAQPLIILAQETATNALVPAKLREQTLVRLLRTAVTLALVLGSAELFWSALESCRIDQRGLEEVVGSITAVMERVRGAGLLG